MDKMTLEELQEELKVLKNEIKTTLMDVREQLLTYVENPFSAAFTRDETLHEGAPKARPAVNIEQTHNEGNGSNGGGGGPVGAIGAVPVSQFYPDGSPSHGYGVAATEPGPYTEASAPTARPAVRVARPGPARQPTSPTPEPEIDSLVDAVYQEPRRPERRGPAETHKPPDETPGELLTAALPTETTATPKRMPTLLQVATLSPWLEQGLRRVGRDRLKVIVEVYVAMGGISPQFQDLLLKLISLSDSDQAKPGVPLGECLAVLAELDNLVWRSRNDPTGAALLAALLNKNGAPGQLW